VKLQRDFLWSGFGEELAQGLYADLVGLGTCQDSIMRS
jgi:hypothetical protein